MTILRAVLERLVPKDEFAGAIEAGVDEYVIRILGLEMAAKKPMVEAGLDGVEAEANARSNKKFTELEPARQDEILTAIEQGQLKSAWNIDAKEWFTTLVALAMEGFYSDPGNGGNKGEVSWKMIGYEPGAARHG